jgi:uncharacterized membrane protein HdeD (DUF308 family)
MAYTTSVHSVHNDMSQALHDALGTYWRFFMFQGAMMAILGIVAIVFPVPASIAVDFFVGWLFLISGVAGLMTMFAAKGIPAFLWSLITAALNTIVGVLLLWKPIEGEVSLTLLLTGSFIAEGVFQIVTSIAYREVLGRSWGWMILSGVADIALAAVIILNWPNTASWTLGLIVGINLLTSGAAILAMGFSGRKFVQSLGSSLSKLEQQRAR